MHILVLALILPLMAVNGHDVLYHMILETGEYKINGVACNDGCEIDFHHSANPTGPRVKTLGTGAFPAYTISITLNSTMSTKLKSDGISHRVCLSKKTPSPPADGIEELKKTPLFCHQLPPLTFQGACANRREPDAIKVAKLSCPARVRDSCETASFKYRMSVETESGKPCPLGDEPFSMHWAVENIMVSGACENCSIQPAIMLGNTYRTLFVNDQNLPDEYIWYLFSHGLSFVEMWYVGPHPIGLPIGVTYVAKVTGKATVAELCAGITANRAVPCKADDNGRRYCTEISYTLKLSLTMNSLKPCPRDAINLIRFYDWEFPDEDDEDDDA